MFLPKTLVDISEWIGVITGIVGAIIISSNIGLVGWGYVVFWISSITFMYFSWRLKRWPLFTMNLIFLCINTWGIWRWLLVPIGG